MRDRSPQTLWETALGQLELQVTRPNFETWLRSTTGLRLDGECLAVGVPTDFALEWLRSRMSPLINRTVSQLTGSPTSVAFEVLGVQPVPTVPSANGRHPQPAAATAPVDLNPRLTFESFTVVKSNRLAYRAARKVASSRSDFNPLVLSGEPSSTPSGNLLLDELMGAELVWTTRPDRDQTLQAVFAAAWEAGKRPYLIPYGGSNPTGAAAYVFALKELLDQGSLPDWIVFSSSSGGTQAGLVSGARLFGFHGKILGISVDEEAVELQERVAKLATQTAELLGNGIIFSPDEIMINDDYLGGGYGVVGEPEREALRLFARTEGLLLDPVYTGRAGAGLIDLTRRGFFTRGQTVLFWHTGGAPALFANQYVNSL